MRGIRLDVIDSEATLCQEQCSRPGIHKNIGATPENKLSGSGVSKPRWAFLFAEQLRYVTRKHRYATAFMKRAKSEKFRGEATMRVVVCLF
jgi:hypothetical protein